MTRRLAFGAMVLGGIALVAVGVQKYLDTRAASQVASRFMTALAAGDRVSALSLVHPDRLAEFEARQDPNDASLQLPQVDLEFRIHHVDISGDRAEVQLVIEKNGFVLQPVVHLLRSKTSLWRVDRIDRLEVDRRWDDLLETRAEAARQAGQQLAEELKQALEASEGVEVERVPLDNLTQ